MSDFALVPAYNEEKNIGKLITRLKKIKRLHIIVVDDGSKDKTFSVARRYKVEAIQHEENHGKAEAIRTGLRYILRTAPDGTNVVIIDSDLQYDPEDAPKLLQPLDNGEADFVTGFRDFRNVPFRHRLGNFVWRTTFNLLFGKKLRDTNCGYIAMNKKTAEFIVRSIYGGYIAENAMLLDVIRHKLRIRQVPVKVHYHVRSKVSRGVRMVLGVWVFILREGLKYRFGKK